jgi:hypothetical protein
VANLIAADAEVSWSIAIWRGPRLAALAIQDPST